MGRVRIAAQQREQVMLNYVFFCEFHRDEALPFQTKLQCAFWLHISSWFA
jgi:hypothetical protein